MGLNSSALMAGALWVGGEPKGKKTTWVDEYGITHVKFAPPTAQQIADHKYTINRVLEICPEYSQGFGF
tara:strand:+ start:109 stop:315 length:207 start_codon:yes stop_codon:yes gene_type:complete